MNPKYLIVPQPSSKPPRFMLVINDRIVAKSLLRSDARQIITALETACLHPDLAKTINEKLLSAGL